MGLFIIVEETPEVRSLMEMGEVGVMTLWLPSCVNFGILINSITLISTHFFL